MCDKESMLPQIPWVYMARVAIGELKRAFFSGILLEGQLAIADQSACQAAIGQPSA
jgi:hypothetical protein